MAKREMQVIKRKNRGKRKKKDRITKMNIQDKMVKKVATKNLIMMKESLTKNIMKVARREKGANMVTKNSTRRGQKLLVTTKKRTRMNTIRNINFTMISTKKANTRYLFKKSPTQNSHKFLKFLETWSQTRASFSW